MRKAKLWVMAAVLFLPQLNAGVASGRSLELVSVSSAGEQSNWHSTRPCISSDGRFVAFESLAGNLVPGDTNGVQDVFVHDRETGATTRVSVSTGGAEANDQSAEPAISADGRYVAFLSGASNLVPGDNNGAWDVFVHDLQTGETTRVSVSSGGIEGNDLSALPSISADGRYVTFESEADNLVAGDNNGYRDIFVHDTETGQTTRVSVSSAGLEGDADCDEASISGEGRYVAFRCDATNLVPGDNNGYTDILVHDTETGQTARVSVSSAGVEGDFISSSPSISSDGRYVAFNSRAGNLVENDTNGVADIFVHDRQTGQTSRVSVSSAGAETDGDAFESMRDPSISPDGRYVAFARSGSNVVPDDTNEALDVFVHDRRTGRTVRVSVNAEGIEGNGHSYMPSIASQARCLAFMSEADNLVIGDTNNRGDIFVVEQFVPQGMPWLMLLLDGGE